MTEQPSVNNCSGRMHHTQPSFNALEVIVESASDEGKKIGSILPSCRGMYSNPNYQLESTNSFYSPMYDIQCMWIHDFDICRFI